jgi:type IV secretory pathway TraG/TraD family ATPase VirD4
MLPSRDLSVFALTNSRGGGRPVGLLQRDRLAHMFLIGKTGTGKSTLMETLMRDDLDRGRGFVLIDPHGDLAGRVAAHVPFGRQDVTIVDLAHPAPGVGYNPLLRVSEPLRSIVVSGAMDVFKMMWADAWGVRMENILRHSLWALVEQPRATLQDLIPLLTETARRGEALTHVSNEETRRFFLKELPSYPPRFLAESLAPIQNKVAAFLADARVRSFIAPEGEGLRLRDIMDRGAVLIVNLAEGRIGADSAHLVGGLLVTALGSAAYSRAALPAAKRRPFIAYVDEFQNFTTLAVAKMLSEMRKFGVGMVLANQFIAQLEPQVAHSVLGNAGTLVAFRLGGDDAFRIAREFDPIFGPPDLISLPNYHIYIRLLVEGAPTLPFSAVTLSA